jgi:hypothetical protein
MRITSGGNILINQTSAITGVSTSVEMSGVGSSTATSQASYNVYSWHGTNATWRGYLQFHKSRGTTIGSYTSVANGDDLGTLRWLGADGSGVVIGAEINGMVDGTPGVNDMPTRLVFSTTADGASSPTERMRITSGGAIQMSNNATTFSIGSIPGVQRIQYGTGGFTTEFAFLQPNDGYTPIGASAFNTRSDYRLKEDLKEFSGLSLVANMKVYDFKWKENEERNYGFMAHELQEVVPYVVTGTKDGMFEDEPQIQGMDASKLVPVLVKSIQELKSENDNLKSRLEVLEQA